MNNKSGRLKILYFRRNQLSIKGENRCKISPSDAANEDYNFPLVKTMAHKDLDLFHEFF